MSYRAGGVTYASRYDHLMACIEKSRKLRRLCLDKVQTLDDLIESLHAEVRKELTKGSGNAHSDTD